MNTSIIRFGIIAFLFFVLWYLVYELWLLPDGRLDLWLSLNIVGISDGILRVLGYDTYSVNRVVGIGEAPGIKIVDGCNGISAMGLFLGFILAYPGEWKYKISFCIAGIGIIYLVNIARVVALAITQHSYPSLFGFMHTYSTSAIFYITIFLFWMILANFSETNQTAQWDRSGRK